MMTALSKSVRTDTPEAFHYYLDKRLVATDSGRGIDVGDEVESGTGTRQSHDFGSMGEAEALFAVILLELERGDSFHL